MKNKKDLNNLDADDFTDIPELQLKELNEIDEQDIFSTNENIYTPFTPTKLFDKDLQDEEDILYEEEDLNPYRILN